MFEEEEEDEEDEDYEEEEVQVHRHRLQPEKSFADVAKTPSSRKLKAKLKIENLRLG